MFLKVQNIEISRFTTIISAVPRYIACTNVRAGSAILPTFARVRVRIRVRVRVRVKVGVRVRIRVRARVRADAQRKSWQK